MLCFEMGVFSTMLERATLSLGTTKVTSKVALWAGSSQQGRARRASAAWERRERGKEERRQEEEKEDERRGCSSFGYLI